MPVAHYLVRMLDGRIDVQGTIENLEMLGRIDAIIHDPSLNADITTSGKSKDDEPAEVIAAEVIETKPYAVSDDEEPRTGASSSAKKPRKLVKEEHMAKGNVKWPIYKTYMAAS